MADKATGKKRPSPEQDENGRFLPGNSGNGGRPKGARNKLGEAFLSDMYESWEKSGKETIDRVREEKPDVYLKVVASILPQQLNVKVSEFDELTDEQLDTRIAALARALELEIGVGKASSGAREAPAGKSLN